LASHQTFAALQRLLVVFLTPKELHNKAQGREAQRAPPSLGLEHPFRMQKPNRVFPLKGWSNPSEGSPLRRTLVKADSDWFFFLVPFDAFLCRLLYFMRGSDQSRPSTRPSSKGILSANLSSPKGGCHDARIACFVLFCLSPFRTRINRSQ
jgi:hypothetical protein